MTEGTRTPDLLGQKVASSQTGGLPIRLLKLAAVLAFLTISPSVAGAPQLRCANPPIPPELYPSTVTRIVDGDTIDVSVDGRRRRVRFIGVDTPEVYPGAKLNRDAQTLGVSRKVVQALGRLSSEFTRQQLLAEDVALELDVQTHDRYGRLLAYVWLADGTLFNMLIVREGYAFVYTFPPNVKYADIFLACQREAREKRRGLWGN